MSMALGEISQKSVLAIKKHLSVQFEPASLPQAERLSLRNMKRIGQQYQTSGFVFHSGRSLHFGSGYVTRPRQHTLNITY